MEKSENKSQSDSLLKSFILIKLFSISTSFEDRCSLYFQRQCTTENAHPGLITCVTILIPERNFDYTGHQLTTDKQFPSKSRKALSPGDSTPRTRVPGIRFSLLHGTSTKAGWQYNQGWTDTAPWPLYTAGLWMPGSPFTVAELMLIFLHEMSGLDEVHAYIYTISQAATGALKMVREITGGTISCFPIDVGKAILYELKDRAPTPQAHFTCSWASCMLSADATSQTNWNYIMCLLSAVFCLYFNHMYLKLRGRGGSQTLQSSFLFFLLFKWEVPQTRRKFCKGSIQ